METRISSVIPYVIDTHFEVASPANEQLANEFLGIENPVEEAPPPFLAEYSDQEKFLLFLYKRGIVDDNSFLNKKYRSLSWPIPTQDDVAAFEAFIQELLATNIGNLPLGQFIQTLCSDGKIPLLNVEAVGGFSRQLLLKVLPYLKQLFSRLTGLQEEAFAHLFSEDLLKEQYRKLPDTDLRFYVPSHSEEGLRHCTETLITLLSRLYQTTPDWIKYNFFSKLNVVYDANNQYSIASFQELEFVFVKKILHSHLFILDSFRISILPMIFGKHAPLQFASENGWQSLIDHLGRVLHLGDLNGIRPCGFPRAISYLIRGYIWGDSQDNFILLIKKSITLEPHYVDVPGQLATLFQNIHKYHHPEDSLAPFLLAATASAHLSPYLLSAELHAFWKLIERQQNIGDGKQIGEPLLDRISLAVAHQLPIEPVLAAAALGGWLHLFSQGEEKVFFARKHMGTPALQIPIGNNVLLLPFSLMQSIELLRVFFEENEREPEKVHFILETLEERIFTPNTIQNTYFDQIKETCEILLESPLCSCRYLGYLLFLKSPSDTSYNKISTLFKHLTFALHFRNETAQEKLFCSIEHLVSVSGEPFLLAPIQTLQQFLQTTPSEKELQAFFVIALAKTHESKTALIAYTLWTSHRSKYPLKERAQWDIKLIATLLPEKNREALVLFCQWQEERRTSKQEFALISHIFSVIQQKQPAEQAALLPRALDALMTTLSPFRYPKKMLIDVNEKARVNELIKILKMLLKTGSSIHAKALWELIAVHPFLQNEKESIEKGWLLLAEGALLNQNSIETITLWKRVEQLNIVKREKEEPYIRISFLLTKQMIVSKGTEKWGALRVKKLLKQQHPQSVPLIWHHLNDLMDKQRIKEAAHVLENTYRPHLSSEELHRFRKLLFTTLIENNAFTLAADIWFLLSSEKALTSHGTETLLEGLIQKKTSMKIALKILSFGRAKTALSPEKKGLYLTQIASFIARKGAVPPKLYAALLRAAFRLPEEIPSETQELAVLAIDMLMQMETRSLRTRKRTLQILPALCQSIQQSQSPTSAYQLLILIEKETWEISSHLHPYLFTLVRQVIFYHLDQREYYDAFAWVSQAKKFGEPSSFSSWVPFLWNTLQPNHPLLAAELILEYPDLFLDFSQEMLKKEIAYLASIMILLPDQSMELLRRYPPSDSTPWQHLFSRSQLEVWEIALIHKLWEAFYKWQENQKPENENLSSCWLIALQAIQPLKENAELSPFPQILDQIADEKSHLSRLLKPFSNTHQCATSLTLCGALPHWENKKNDSEDLFIRAAMRLNRIPEVFNKLIHAAADYKTSEHFILTCRLLSLFFTVIYPQENEASNVNLEAFFLFLLKKGHSFKDAIPHALPRLIGISKTLRRHALHRIDPLLFADALCRYFTPIGLKECRHYLNLIKEDERGLLSITWGSYLTQTVQQLDLEDSLELDKGIKFLISHADKWKEGEPSLEICAKYLVFLMCGQISNCDTYDLFCENVRLFFKALCGNPIELQEIEVPFEIVTKAKVYNGFEFEISPVVETLPSHCPRFKWCEQIDNEEDSLIKKNYFFYGMGLVLQEALIVKIQNTRSVYIVNQFININLDAFLESFPQDTEVVVSLLDMHSFRWKPSLTHHFCQHQLQAGKLIRKAINLGIYRDHPHIMAKALMYLEHRTLLSLNYSLTEQKGVLLSVLETALSASEGYGTVHAIFVMQGIQKYILRHDPEGVLHCYKIIIDKLDEHFWYVMSGEPLFEWVRMGIMQNQKILCADGTQAGNQIATELCILLFEKVWKMGIETSGTLSEIKPLDIYHSHPQTLNFDSQEKKQIEALRSERRNPSPNGKGEEQDQFGKVVASQNSKFEGDCGIKREPYKWLASFLLLARHARAFNEQRGMSKYYDLVERYVLHFTPTASSQNNPDARTFHQTIFSMIVNQNAEYVHKTMSKEIKSKRCTLMNIWLKKLHACDPDLAISQLNHSLKLDVYKGFRTASTQIKRQLGV